MSTYIEYELDNGEILLIEAEEIEQGGIVKVARGEDGNIIIKANKKFREALSGFKTQARLLIEEIDDLHVSEAEIKFGLTTTGELGNFAIGKVGLDTNYEITLRWKSGSAKTG